MSGEISGNTPGIDPTMGAAPVAPGTEEEVKFVDPSLLSSISSSQAVATLQVLTSDSPKLSSPEEVGVILSSKHAEISSNMWERYQETIDKIEEYKREVIANPGFPEQLREDITKTNISPTESLAEWAKDLPPTVRMDEVENTDNIPLLTMGVAITAAAGVTDLMMVDTVSTQAVGGNPIVSLSSSATQLVDPAIQNDLQIAINLFVTGLVYQSTNEAIARAQGGKPPVTAEFAENFAKTTIAKVKGDEINNYLMRLFADRMKSGDAITPEKLRNYINMAKLMMLAVALAVSYKVETGWITGQEFAALIKGEIKFDKGTAALDAQALFGAYLKDLPPAMREQVINALLEYFDSNPDFDQLLEPQKVYSRVFSNIPKADPQG